MNKTPQYGIVAHPRCAKGRLKTGDLVISDEFYGGWRRLDNTEHWFSVGVDLIEYDELYEIEKVIYGI